ncbi:MAG: M23 family metallopeptidase [Candidatus Eremiobacterota bacterium]
MPDTLTNNESQDTVVYEQEELTPVAEVFNVEEQSGNNPVLSNDPLANIINDNPVVESSQTLLSSAQNHQYKATAFYWPLRKYNITGYRFGDKVIFGKNIIKYHTGEDAEGSAGNPVYAVANGIVLYSGKATGYGYCVVLEHHMFGNFYVRSVYGHLRSVDIQAGWTVGQGRRIGILGTKDENGGYPEHLHFGIRKGPESGNWDYWGYEYNVSSWYNPSQDFILGRLPKPFDPNPIPLWRNSSPNWFTLAKGYFQKYKIDVPVNTTLNFNLKALEGNPDIYVGYDINISPTKNYIAKSIKNGSDTLTFKTKKTTVYIAVHAYTKASWEISVNN